MASINPTPNLEIEDGFDLSDLFLNSYGEKISSNISVREIKNGTEQALLDLYSGCGGMSTGLCLGAQAAGVRLVTRWAVDNNETACQSLQLNHPETNVRKMKAGDFINLLKEWEKLCKQYAVNIDKNRLCSSISSRIDCATNTEDDENKDSVDSGEYEVQKIIDICYVDPEKTGLRGLQFKIRWEGCDASEDTWEPLEGLSKCEEKLKDFVMQGFKSKNLPLPGDVDVICGGPPCQGISGLNRFRNPEKPFEDENNKQIIVFMDIVEFLKPKYVRSDGKRS